MSAVGSHALVVSTGPSPMEYQLFQVQPSGVSELELSPRPNYIDELSSNGAIVLVTTAGVGGEWDVDRIYRVGENRRIERLDSSEYRMAGGVAHDGSLVALSEDSFGVSDGGGTWRKMLDAAGGIVSAVWSQDGRLGVTNGGRHAIVDVATGRLRDLGPDECRAILVWGSGQPVAISTESGTSERTTSCPTTAAVWRDSLGWEELPEGLHPLAWSKDGKWLIVGAGNELRLLDPSTGAFGPSLTIESTPMRAVLLDKPL